MGILPILLTLLILHAPLLFCTGYLVLLMIAAGVYRKPAVDNREEPARTFAILIPAHNEEMVLPQLLQSIQRLDYPAANFHTHVIADNCSDETARVAASFGAQVHVRDNQAQIGKGYALAWGLNEIWAAGQSYDAYILVDADSVLSPNFLRVMQRLSNQGARVVQAYYGVRDPELSWNVGLRYAALAVLHYLRPLGRLVLGGSAGLKGNGMLFTEDLLRQYSWPASGTEDIEYHMLLLLEGHPVTFAPDAAVWAEMPIQFDQSKTQLDRWEHGRLEMARKYLPRLLKAAGRALARGNFRRAYVYLDAVMEHLIPPFSILFGSALLLFLLDLALLLVFRGARNSSTSTIAWLNAALGLSLVGGQMLYLFAGLKMVNAPASIYRQMVFAPLFLLKKIQQYLRIVSGAKPDQWVKTTRN